MSQLAADELRKTIRLLNTPDSVDGRTRAAGKTTDDHRQPAVCAHSVRDTSGVRNPIPSLSKQESRSVATAQFPPARLTERAGILTLPRSCVKRSCEPSSRDRVMVLWHQNRLFHCSLKYPTCREVLWQQRQLSSRTRNPGRPSAHWTTSGLRPESKATLPPGRSSAEIGTGRFHNRPSAAVCRKALRSCG